MGQDVHLPLICNNHLTYVLLQLLMILLGDMMCYLCYFTKNTSCSNFSQIFPKGEIVVPFGLAALEKITFVQVVWLMLLR